MIQVISTDYNKISIKKQKNYPHYYNMGNQDLDKYYSIISLTLPTIPLSSITFIPCG
jgi:hypothetical protein